MITIPDVKGKSLREAKNRFDDWGLRYDQVKEVNSFNTEKGKVIKTEPAIGTQVNYGDLITIYVSKRKTYPIVIIVVAVLLLGLLLGKGTISKIIENAKKPQQQSNVCLLNCDTNGDGIPDTNLDTDGDGKCDSNCDGNVEQNGDGSSADGKKNDNPSGGKKDEGTPTVKVITEKQGGQTVVKVTESKNAPILKYSDGKQTVEYFANGGGTPYQLGQYVIIGNSGTITIYAGNGSGGTTKQIDNGGGNSDDPNSGIEQPEDDPIPQFTVTAPEGYSNNPVVTINAISNVYKMKVMKGDKDIDDVKADGREITGKTSYNLCGANEPSEDACTGTWTFAAWTKSGRGISETVTFNKFDNVPPTFNLTGDLETPKRIIGLIIEAKDNKYTNQSDYFNIFYTNGVKTASEINEMEICKTSQIDNCKMRLVNNEHLGITNADTYSFIVADQAGNYTTEFNCVDGSCMSNLTIDSSKIVSELTPPKFVLNNYDWSTSKVVTIQYPEGWGGEYSLDGGETFQNYMDPIMFNDDGQRHEIIARVMSGTEAVASSSIVIEKIDNVEPTFELGLTDGGKFGIKKDKSIPSSSNIDQIKSGATITCEYKTHSGSEWKKITNLKNITDIGYFDFKCNMVTGSGLSHHDAANNVEGFEPIDVVFDSDGGVFSDEECGKDGQSCNADKSILTRGIKRGESTGSYPRPEKDGYDFGGFKDAESGTSYSARFAPETNVRYKGFWNPGSYTLTWDANGGTFRTDTTTVNTTRVGNGVTIPGTNPTRSGYAFYGWWTSPEEGQGEMITSATKPTKSGSYYAHWEAVSGSFSALISKLGTGAVGTYAHLQNQGGAIRYVSNNVNNYVRLDVGGESQDFRIIGLFGNKVKLISTTPYSSSARVDSEGKAFPESDLKASLNAMPLASNSNVVSTTWKYAAFLPRGYTYEQVDTLLSNSPTSFTAKIVLPYSTDFVYSSNIYQGSVKTSNILEADGSWLMNMVGGGTTYILEGSDQEGYILTHTTSHNVKAYEYTRAFNSYYTFFLSENAQVIGGAGSATDPYIIN